MNPQHDVDKHTIVSTTVRHRITLKEADIREMLKGVPPHARVTITVVSGGDWSGETLDLDDFGGLNIFWEVTTREES